jgi:hypothetical protein
MKLGRRKCLMAAVGILSCTAISQTPTRPHKRLTPEQQQFQADVAEWRTERDALQTKASHDLQSALKSTDESVCNDSKSRMETEKSLEDALKSAGDNYVAFTSNLRSILALAYPTMHGEKSASGPTGLPQTSTEAVSEFEQLEAQSKAYRKAASDAAYNRFKGGNEAPVFGLRAALKLMQGHLEELKFIYDTELSSY